MSVLISDPALCPNDLTRLLLSPAAEWSFQVRVANIAQGGSLIAQHTQYQLIITVSLLSYANFLSLYLRSVFSLGGEEMIR